MAPYVWDATGGLLITPDEVAVPLLVEPHNAAELYEDPSSGDAPAAVA
jgi:hypothetical protein